MPQSLADTAWGWLVGISGPEFSWLELALIRAVCIAGVGIKRLHTNVQGLVLSMVLPWLFLIRAGWVKHPGKCRTNKERAGSSALPET